MDKLRSIASKFEMIGLSSKDVSVDDAVAELMSELMPSSSNSVLNSFSGEAEFPKKESEAAKALQVIYGGVPEGGDHQSSLLKKTDAAREKYLKGCGAKDKTSSALTFNETLKSRLVENLSERMQPLYLLQLSKLDEAFKQGKMSRNECDREMVQFLNETRTAGCLFNIELENALSFIGDKLDDVTNGLFFLFKGDLGDEKNAYFERFDRVVEEATDATFCRSINGDEKKTEFKRALASEARRNLANRLPGHLKKAYFSVESNLQAQLKKEVITYDTYVVSMRNWLVFASVEDASKSILQSLGKKGVDNGVILCHLCSYGGVYNNATFVHKQVANPSPYIPDAIYKFGTVVSEHFNVIPDLNGGNAKKYELLVPELKEKILLTLTVDQQNIIKRNQEILGDLLKNNIIDDKAYKLGKNEFIFKLLSGKKSDADADESRRQLQVLEPYNREIDFYFQAEIGIDLSFKNGYKTEDVLEALIMCLGGAVDNQRDNFILHELCTYKTSNTSYRKDFPHQFRFYETFSIEAREQLFKKLPDPLKKEYAERDQLLRELCKKEHITAEIYAGGMVMFLNKLRDLSKVL